MSKVRKDKAGEVHDILRQERRSPLEAIFSPRSVAVIGATEKEGSVGRAVIENLRAFEGVVYLVNPKRRRVLDQVAYPDVHSLPARPDLAVIVTPAGTVPAVIRQCGKAGIPGAIIISAGFKEIGPEGAALEAGVLAEARRARMRLVGPNCLGVMAPHLGFNATFAAAMAQRGNVAFVSQSGALCTAILDWSLRENVGFSAFVSVGSMLDVGWGDLIQHFGDDPRTRSIVCYMESVGDARAFLSAAREVALSKPIIVIKVGRTDAAAKAASSHTGSLTGSDEVLDAALRRAGVLRVDTIEEVFDMAEVLAKQPRPAGPRLAIVTNAGGPGALATDMLVGSGGKLAELSPETTRALNKLLPAHWSHGNPIDVLGDADPDRYARSVELAAADPGSDGVLVILTPQAMTDATGTAEAVGNIAKRCGKPVLASWMGGPAVDEGEKILNRANVPTFKYPDRAARAFEYMWRYSSNLRALYETPANLPAVEERWSRRQAVVEEILTAVRRAGRTLLTEVESKQLLSAYGIPVVKTRQAKDQDEAVQIAGEIGYPVVLKLYSTTVTHKTDVGGVRLNIPDADGVRRAWREIRSAVQAKVGAEHFQGVTVQPMVPFEGYELILGSSIDAQFGPVLLFGAGGQLVEVMRDRALGLPPLNATLARRLMERPRIISALQGVRGRAPVNLPELVRVVVRFSQLVVEQRRIAEIDINPLVASPGQLTALDARVVLQPWETADEALPRPAIRPYPSQYITVWKLKDGTPVTVRPIRPEDEPAMVKFHQTLSERSVYLRYFGPLKLEQRVAHERLIRICFIDYDREMALVVERRSGEDGPGEILGVGRLSRVHGMNEAEFALLISDPWQGHGLGTQLLKTLVQVGRDEKIERITATILGENRPMQRVCRRIGFKVWPVSGAGEYAAAIEL